MEPRTVSHHQSQLKRKGGYTSNMRNRFPRYNIQDVGNYGITSGRKNPRNPRRLDSNMIQLLNMIIIPLILLI